MRTREDIIQDIRDTQNASMTAEARYLRLIELADELDTLPEGTNDHE